MGVHGKVKLIIVHPQIEYNASIKKKDEEDLYKLI